MRACGWACTFGKTVLLLFWGLCGGVIYISVFLLLSTLSFWFEDRLGVHPPFWNLFAFGRYPLRIYSGFIQFVLTWIIPFGFASFYPSARLIGRAVDSGGGGTVFDAFDGGVAVRHAAL